MFDFLAALIIAAIASVVASLWVVLVTGHVPLKAVAIFIAAFLIVMNARLFLELPLREAWTYALFMLPYCMKGWLIGFIPAGILLLVKMGRRRGVF